MSRLGSLFALLALLFASSQAETIVSDSLGNAIGLPLGGGNATGIITNTNSLTSTSPYTLSVYVNNGENNGVSSPPTSVSGEVESFYFLRQANGLFGNATLVSSGYSRTFSASALTAANPVTQFLGNATNPINNTGLYQFVFTIPVLSSILVNLTYTDSGAPFPVIDRISSW